MQLLLVRAKAETKLDVDLDIAEEDATLANALRYILPLGRLIAKTPRPLWHLMADIAGHIMVAVGYGDQLKRNLELVSGVAPTYRTVARNLSNYYRYFVDVLALGERTQAALTNIVDVKIPTDLTTAARTGPVIVVLSHSGNWDIGGAGMGIANLPVTTVAERLADDDVWEFFCETRKRVGMTILPAKRGVFKDLQELATKKPGIYALLADRDISGRGVEVEMGQPALVGAGPAALALKLNAPLYLAIIRDTNAISGKKNVWRTEVRFKEIPYLATDSVATLSQRWASVATYWIRKDLTQWHMLQKLFVTDLDQARLARARAKVANAEGN